jgi:hypothetical protein
MSDETKKAAGLEYSVTSDCQAAAPLNAERLFQRWFTVHTPRGARARNEANLERRKTLRDAEAAALMVLAAVDIPVRGLEDGTGV